MTAEAHDLAVTLAAGNASHVGRRHSPETGSAVARRERWKRAYGRRLIVVDLGVVVLAVALAAWIQLVWIANAHLSAISSAPWQYTRVALLMCALWIVMLMLFQTRDHKIAGHGTAEYRRVINATAVAFGVAAIGFVIMQSQGIRTQLLVALPVGFVGLVLGRWSCRQWLVRRRNAGEYMSRALIIGNHRDTEYVINALRTGGDLGYAVVGLVFDGAVPTPAAPSVAGHAVPTFDDVSQAAHIAETLDCDAVIVASTRPDDPEFVKRLAWQLEGAVAELVLSSPLADVAGPRMALKPIEGLPLIQVEIPTFDGGRYVTKRLMDIIISIGALIAIAVATPFIAVAILVDSRGPVFYRQERVGRDGVRFRMFKFRSMIADAHDRRHALLVQNDGSGPLFKLKADPRITRVGRFLRKFSLDELPQFWNVLIGDMSIVGPRPPLPEEVEAYEGSAHRRLYIRPGITGPWQISGRSDLTWDESVRLDLSYVENWSVLYDLTIMLRTPRAILSSRGAY
ncbi:sugar transferase [Humibacter ginsenosidimutans]|uniref:Sugar transferase n=1 Tax=Humibacter ginsenosidimutans TaxID=2599293 RepID=A0A5B8M3Y5_9MICO|nr:sugar transferase [Humibacter ginsenosidimutans]QDZ14996.1 sugar transferase [Humibacter ginsenosidimutans]